jgi:CSLREA domain-containing protein
VTATIIRSFLSVLLLVYFSSAFSAEFNVNSTVDAVDADPGDGVCETALGNAVCTLRGAIQEANALLGKDIINVPAGVYTLTITGTEDYRTYDDSILDLDITDHLDVIGASRDTTIIEAGATRGALGSKVMTIMRLTNVFMTDVTIRHGTITEYIGAGIQNSGHLTITNCHIRDNTADNNSDGGGIGTANGVTIVDNCTFSGNEALAGGAGGAAYVGTFRNSQFTNNTANEGGAVYGGNIENCYFENNTGGYGGAVSSNGRVRNSVFINNNGTWGGAIYSAIGSLRVEDSLISGNTATSRGGGLYFNNTFRSVVINSLIADNNAPSGGGIYSEQGAVNVNNSTIIGNNGGSEGGGILNGMNGQFYIYSSTIYNNSATSGRNIAIPPVPNANVYIKNSIVGHSGTSSSCSGSAIVSQGYNLETADSCGFSLPTDLPNTDPQLGALADNGGFTTTLMPASDSPVIDAGDASGCQNSFSERTVIVNEPAETDQRGANRNVDGNADGSATCDIGAVEYVPPMKNLPPFAKAGDDIVVTPNSTVNLNGGQSYDFDGSLSSYLWNQTAGSTVNLNNADTIDPWFTAPDASGTLTFALTVADNNLVEDQDTVDVIVNRPPVANAGEDINIAAGDSGTLDATLSTDDGTIVSYEWKFLWGYNPYAQRDRTGVTPSVPGVEVGVNQSLVYRLTVTDDLGFIDTDMVVAHVIVTAGNIPPIANAGEDITVLPGTVVELDGSGSTDSDGTITSYNWSSAYGIRIREPESSAIRVVMPEEKGKYKIDLFVIDDGNLVGADTVTITVSNQTNQLPNAMITAPTRANIGDTVTLDGSNSTDVDGAIVSYEWTQISGATVALTNVGNHAEFVVPDSATVLGFQLKVTDNEGGHSTTIHELNINQRPTANAGDDISVEAGMPVYLDATGSSDADGGIHSYLWSQQSGPAISIQNSNNSNASFDTSNVEGDVVIALTVTDNEGATNTDTLVVTIADSGPANQMPNAVITALSRANIGSTVTLDSSNSTDSDGSLVSFEWTQLSGDSVTLTDVGNNAEFVVPDSGSVLVFQLQVTDNADGKATTTHELTINQQPVANAGDDISIEAGALVNLNAVDSSDADGSIQSYLWSQQSGPGITLQNSDSSIASFDTSNMEGEVVIALTVTDNEGAINTDAIHVTVMVPAETPNNSPGTDNTPQGNSGGGALGLEFLFLSTFLLMVRQRVRRTLAITN